jgi:hypothetical protein
MRVFNIRAFRAIEDEQSCKEYIKGHKKVLEDYGVTMITSGKPNWISDPSVYCVVAETVEDKKMVGGVRCHISDGKNPLPMEEALGGLDEGIYLLVNSYQHNGVGELCGLWNDKACSNVGLGIALTRAGISITNQLNFKILMGICAAFTMKMFNQVGFRINNSMKIKGEYPYPTKE